MLSKHDVRYIESACVIAVASALFNFPLSMSDLILADMHFAIASSPLQPDSSMVASIKLNIHIFLILLTLFSSDDSSHLILTVV
jgi:hypothetical protein